MTPLKVCLEGWRGIPHSYALINYYQAREFFNDPQLQLYHQDAPYYGGLWQQDPVLMQDMDQRFFELKAPAENELMDVWLRYKVPFTFDLVPTAKKTILFLTAEYGYVEPSAIAGDIFNKEITIVTPSQWSKQGLLKSGIAASQIHVIPHGVDPQRYYPVSEQRRQQMRSGNGIKPDDFVFLHVSAMSKNKGLNLLIKSFVTLAKKYDHIKLLLKGTDSIYLSRDLLDEALSKMLSAEEKEFILKAGNIIYVGNTMSVQDMNHFYQVADCLVSPYRAEGFNLPVLEAMACGVPVICTAGGATEDFAKDDLVMKIKSTLMTTPMQNPSRDAFYYEPDQEHLTYCMEQMMLHQDYRAALRATTPGYVQENYAWSKVVLPLIQLFD